MARLFGCLGKLPAGSERLGKFGFVVSAELLEIDGSWFGGSEEGLESSGVHGCWVKAGLL